ncbi:Ig-like domain-containing protein [Roseburia sp. BX1005]|uniref:Ig-like domain-containing protein n=1 Tax=Roseburia zhanii TaxID=2763064 RepID=A0A923LQG8_9FIRM|nr:Ig-like domain-containing protein [Roseburia zhanii]MBC5715259.1 Ig-like domain-containing protein [Roseburia zhanii]
MKKNPIRRLSALILVCVLAVSSIVVSPTDVQAAANAKKITLSTTKQIVGVGKSVTLKVKAVQPKKASKKVTYTSSNPDVATVTAKGKVTGKSIGNATITVVSATNPKAKAKCKITVVQAATSIQTAKSIVMQKGKKVTIKYGVTPGDANKQMIFTTSNKKVATVDKKGKITAKKPGKATITMTAAAGGKKAKIKVTVKKKITVAKSVTLDQTSLSLKPSETATLTATVNPAKAAGKKVYWYSSDSDVATVNANGVVTAVADGAATITAVASDSGAKSASCSVTVATPAPNPTPAPTPAPNPTPAPTPTPETVDVTSVTVDPEKVRLVLGRTELANVTATVAPENATDKTITWTTDNDKVATVEATEAGAKITAVAAGTAKITATAKNGVKAEIAVTVKEAGEVTVRTFDDSKNYKIIFTDADGEKIQRNVTAREMEVAYKKYQEFVAAKTVDALWNMITKENLKAFAALDDASIDVTTEANKKTIITVDSEGTYSAVLTRTDDSIKVTVSSGSDAARSAVISNIDMTAKTATLEYKGTSAALAFTADKATLAKDGSIVTLEYKDHQYILTMDNALASEFYDAVKDVSLIKLPATFEEVNDNIAIEEVEKTVLAAFDFDEDAVDGKITGTNAVATVNGNGVSIEKTDKLLGTGALKLENSSYLDVKKTDGKPVVSGQKAITISYYSKTDAGSGWAYFISKDDQSPVYQKEYYLGILDKPEINVERYANGRVNEANTGSRNGSEWTRIDVVYAETSTELYVNGVLADTKPASTSIEDSIGTNSIFHIGQATWGSGEYFTGMIDNFTVYGSALSSNEIQALYKADTAK